ncbi:hypothetical protein THAOC_01943, partial [Thalassiosira oceanica]
GLRRRGEKKSPDRTPKQGRIGRKVFGFGDSAAEEIVSSSPEHEGGSSMQAVGLSGHSTALPWCTPEFPAPFPVKTSSFHAINLEFGAQGPEARRPAQRGKERGCEDGSGIAPFVSHGQNTHRNAKKLQGIDNDVNICVSPEFREQSLPASAAVALGVLKVLFLSPGAKGSRGMVPGDQLLVGNFLCQQGKLFSHGSDVGPGSVTVVCPRDK